MESDWDMDLGQVPEYPSRPHAEQRKPKPLNRHSQLLKRPPKGWPRASSKTWCPTPVHSPEYIPMTSSPPTPKPSEIRKNLWREARMRPQGWPRSAEPEISQRPANLKFQDDAVYTNPIDRHLYDEPREEGEDRNNNNPLREEEDNGHYELMENKETMV